MARTLAFGAALTQGPWPCQEDGFVVDPARRIFAVADGFGGRGAGDMAAKLALAELRGKTAEAVAGEEEGASPSQRRQRACFEAANKQILTRNQSRPANGKGGCSLVVAELDAHGSLTVSQSGACAAFHLRAGRIVPVILPQAPLREEFQALLPQEALGLGDRLSLESRTLSLESGDIFFLCSSGVDFEAPAFQQALLEQVALRLPGDSLEGLCRHLVENASLSAQSWNRTLLAVEKI